MNRRKHRQESIAGSIEMAKGYIAFMGIKFAITTLSDPRSCPLTAPCPNLPSPSASPLVYTASVPPLHLSTSHNHSYPNPHSAPDAAHHTPKPATEGNTSYTQSSPQVIPAASQP